MADVILHVPLEVVRLVKRKRGGPTVARDMLSLAHCAFTEQLDRRAENAGVMVIHPPHERCVRACVRACLPAPPSPPLQHTRPPPPQPPKTLALALGLDYVCSIRAKRSTELHLYFPVRACVRACASRWTSKCCSFCGWSNTTLGGSRVYQCGNAHCALRQVRLNSPHVMGTSSLFFRRCVCEWRARVANPSISFHTRAFSGAWFLRPFLRLFRTDVVAILQ